MSDTTEEMVLVKDNDSPVEILLVEDNPYDAELTQRALKKRGVFNKLIHLKDGAEALDFIFAKGEFSKRNSTEYPKVILLDLKLPKIDGIEVIKALKSDEKTKTIPIVVLTSSAEEKDIIITYNLGVNSFITKPVDFEQFSKTISEMGYYWVFINKPPFHK